VTRRPLKNDDQLALLKKQMNESINQSIRYVIFTYVNQVADMQIMLMFCPQWAWLTEHS